MIPDDVRREIDTVKQGASYTGGSFSLAVAPATSTVVSRRGISSSSVITPIAFSSAASNADIVRIVPTKDGFTVYHTSSASARTFRYSFITPIT